MPRWLALAVLVLGAGCGDDLDSETLIGATCKKTDDCDVTGVCITTGAGMCTLPCEFPGRAQQCPIGSYCDELKVETADEDEASTMILCLPACDGKSDCRDGYECTGVSAGPGKVCKPK
ncbi:MAG TPA: hypothetical protein VJR89_20555 [Polyangiales bacterium]|nr:hypothetical protein [Polyangiales bacterium]